MPDWLERNVQPQDSVLVQGRQEEPMVRANHGASDQGAREMLWRHMQRQSDRYGRPRIPVQPNVKGAPDIESLAVKRRGVSADRQQQHREKSRQRNWEERRKPKETEEWEQVIGKTRKRGKRSA